MATADNALDTARSFLGEGPQRFCAWYPAPIGTAWCAIFQSYVLTQVGIPTHFAWVSGGFDQYRAEGRTFPPYGAEPGDLVAFDYDGRGPNNYDHIAMVESINADGIIAINGNWENKVQRVLHRWDRSGFAGGIAEIARPAYAPAPTPPAPIPPTPEDDDMASVLGRDEKTGAIYHVCGNIKVPLTDQKSIDLLMFFGVKWLGNMPPEWLSALGTVKA